MGKLFSGFGIIILVGAIFIANMVFFSVKETEHVIVLQFGDPVQVYSEAGLHMKVPWFETVSLDRRNIEYDMPQPQTIISVDGERLMVDAFIRYQITDPLAYYASFKQGSSNDWNVIRQVGNGRLQQVLEDSLRGAMGDALITEIITLRRKELMAEIKESTAREAKRFGVEIIDVRIKRADFPAENADKVFNRMRSERQQQAQRIRAEGEEKARQIRAEADKAVTTIVAKARETALTTQGQADGVRNCIFAGAYEGLPIRLDEVPVTVRAIISPDGSNITDSTTGEVQEQEITETRTDCRILTTGKKDPRRAEFFAFYRSLQSYETALSSDDTTLVLSPDSEFFRYFKDLQGR